MGLSLLHLSQAVLGLKLLLFHPPPLHPALPQPCFLQTLAGLEGAKERDALRHPLSTSVPMPPSRSHDHHHVQQEKLKNS